MNFDKIAGYESIRKELETIVGWYASPKENEGIKLPRGVLLVGLPGSGKTLMLRAIRDSAPLPVFVFEERGEEDSVDEMKSLCAKAAEEKDGAILLIDEMDSLLDNTPRMTRCLKEVMDGLNAGARILFVATANSSRKIDRALFRPGRFDRNIRVSLPDKSDRQKILSYYLKLHDQEFPEEDVEYLVEQMNHCSGAEIAAVVEDAVLRLGSGELTVDDVERSIARVYDRELPDENKEKPSLLLCVHESGHAALALHRNDQLKLLRVTTTAAESHRGACFLAPKEEEERTLENQIARIEVALGGPTATRILLGCKDDGSGDDFEKARTDALNLVNYYGYRGAKNVLSDYSQASRNESWLTCYLNERRARKIVIDCQKRVERYVRKNREAILRLARELQEKGKLRGVQAADILQNKTTKGA